VQASRTGEYSLTLLCVERRVVIEIYHLPMDLGVPGNMVYRESMVEEVAWTSRGPGE
jgi:hypothetical protein